MTGSGAGAASGVLTITLGAGVVLLVVVFLTVGVLGVSSLMEAVMVFVIALFAATANTML
jgi:hypothetical protein